MILETVVGAVVPVLAESVKQLIVRWTGGVKPATVDEQIRLMKAESDGFATISQRRKVMPFVLFENFSG